MRLPNSKDPVQLRETDSSEKQKTQTGQETKEEFPAFGGTKQILFERTAKTEMNYFSNKVKRSHVFTTLLGSEIIGEVKLTLI